MQKMIFMMCKTILFILIVLFIFVIFVNHTKKANTNIIMQYGLIYNKYCEKTVVIRYNAYNHKEKVINKNYFIIVLSKGKLYKIQVSFDDYKTFQVGKTALFDINLLKNLEVDL